ncbi:MAG: glycosyltransferase family 2 protein [Candidatus Pacebacteria bacterium]|nr:glycosyltransferase family 2 protein [Candidatus Paceibacterota bacterium]
MDYLKAGTAKDFKNTRDKRIYRFFEILPGAISWTTLIGALFLSWKAPFFISCFLIGFVIFWLFRTVYFSFHLRAGFKKMKQHEKTNWLEKLEQLSVINNSLETKNYKLQTTNWTDIYHLILLPNLKEPIELMRESMQSLVDSDYPKDKMIVVLSFEQRAGPERKIIAQKIEQEFSNIFFKLLITFHPDNIPGELIAHGSNDTWAAKQAKELIINPLEIPYENIIVSCFDIDTRPFPKYFSCLSWHYLTSKKPTKTSFQPIPLYTNNIWDASLLSKVFSFSASFWQIMSQERPEKLLTFSSHSMSFKALNDVGFKQTNVVSDDSRIFWQCFFQYNGDYRVKPIFYPISMDANVAKTFWSTLKQIYKQQQRWAYGVGDIPYSFFAFLKNKTIPLRQKISRGFELVEGHWSWATVSILIFSFGWLPVFLGGNDFSYSVMAYNLPKIISRIMTLTMLGLIGSIYISILLLPPKPPDYGRYKYFVFALGWFLVPITMIFFTSIPALDAQTRWMFGKYMGFWCTPKIRKPSTSES